MIPPSPPFSTLYYTPLQKPADPNLVDEGAEDLRALHKIEFPLRATFGIASYVACTGEQLQHDDAYSAPRFNGNMDLNVRYPILCVPLMTPKGQVQGVLQLGSSIPLTGKTIDIINVFGSQLAVLMHFMEQLELLKANNSEDAEAIRNGVFETWYQVSVCVSQLALSVSSSVSAALSPPCPNSLPDGRLFLVCVAID